MDNQFPKFQYSAFDEQRGQYVVRSNDKTEFETLVANLKKELITSEKPQTSVAWVNEVSPVSKEARWNCDICGEPAEYRTGKFKNKPGNWSGYKCTVNPSHKMTFL